MLTDSQQPLTFELILECLSAVEEDPSDNKKWDIATQNSVHWLVSRLESDGGLVGDDSGTGHLYCPKGCRAGPGWGEAEEIAWDKWRDLAAFQIRMFSYKAQAGIEKWRAAWEKSVTHCVDCAVGYASAEASAIQR